MVIREKKLNLGVKDTPNHSNEKNPITNSLHNSFDYQFYNGHEA